MSTIKVNSLYKNYGETEALKGLSFEINKGEVIGFLGPNGAGKTTTMKILTCYMSATSGEANVAGFDCMKDSLKVRSKIGYLSESNALYTDMTVFEYLHYIAELHDIPSKAILGRIKIVTDECGLGLKINSVISELSKGYRQRVGFAAALIHDPEILILDEPTVGLDPNQIIEIRNLIKTLGKDKTVILCSHILSEVELTCNRILIINNGKIIASGTPAELKKKIDTGVNLTLVIKGNKEKVTKLLKSITGVKRVKVSSAYEKGAYTYEILGNKNKDIRSKISKEVFENEFVIIEMHKKVISLEETFNELTKI